MRRTVTVFGVLGALLIAASAIMTTIILRSYDVSRPDIGSGTLDVQADTYPVVVLGDSLAAGVGASSPEAGFAFRVFSSIATNHPEALLHNFGQSGATTADVLSDQLARFDLVRDPQVVIVMVGTNDIIQQVPDGEFRNNWQEIINRIAAPGRTVIILNIPKFATTPVVPENLKGVADTETVARNTFIAQTVSEKENIKLLDFYELSARELQPGSNLLSEDQFHPNDSGYSRLSEAVTKKVEE